MTIDGKKQVLTGIYTSTIVLTFLGIMGQMLLLGNRLYENYTVNILDKGAFSIILVAVLFSVFIAGVTAASKDKSCFKSIAFWGNIIAIIGASFSLIYASDASSLFIVAVLLCINNVLTIIRATDIL